MEFWRRNPAGAGIKGHFVELVRLELGQGPVYEGLFASALDYIDRRIDCSDFVMLGIIRARRQFPDSPLLSAEIHDRMKRSILDFKYHPEEPGLDSLCTWTENHQIMFAANAFLAGALYPEEIFTNTGERGREKAQRARPRILRWLELRYKTGFSEWLSHIYYDEDITALTNLVDFSEDPEIARKSAMVLDLIFLDMALNSFRGTFGSTHGRSYAEEKRDGHLESTADTSKLMFGMGLFSGRDNMSAISLALSGYRLPESIYAIATDRETTFENRQRAGIRIAEAQRWGLTTRPGDVESAMALLTLEAYTHPRTIMQTMELFDRFRWWGNAFFGPFARYKGLLTALRKTRLLSLLARLIEKDITRNVREEVNILTYRSPEAMLSTAQDWKSGYGGDQQHILQATLSPRAIVFPTHPGHAENTSGGYWVGSGTLPRAVQVGPVAIAVYRASRVPGLYMTNELFFTHAWFPDAAFDEVREGVPPGAPGAPTAPALPRRPPDASGLRAPGSSAASVRATSLSTPAMGTAGKRRGRTPARSLLRRVGRTCGSSRSAAVAQTASSISSSGRAWRRGSDTAVWAWTILIPRSADSRWPGAVRPGETGSRSKRAGIRATRIPLSRQNFPRKRWRYAPASTACVSTGLARNVRPETGTAPAVPGPGDS